MTKETAKMVKPPTPASTRTGNGNAVLAGVDMRTLGGRRFKELCADLANHLGTAPTAPQIQIIRRSAALAAWCEAQEATQASTGELRP